jgi:hypothetical protein
LALRGPRKRVANKSQPRERLNSVGCVGTLLLFIIIITLFVCVGPRKRVYCSLQAYCTYPMCVQCSHFHRQEAPRHNGAGDPSSERWNLLGEKRPVIWPKVASSTLLRDLLHAANLRHGTDGFTSPPKEVVLRIFFALKNPGLNPRTWVLKASTQPLDHRNRYYYYLLTVTEFSLRGSSPYRYRQNR